MMKSARKIVLIGTGSVGASFAFAALNQDICDELVMIDLNTAKVAADAADMQDGLANFTAKVNVWHGDYSDCHDADIVVICAGIAQKPGQTRLELIQTNVKIASAITKDVVASGFDGIFLVASNPVDIISYAVWKTSGFAKERVIGSGTALDTARLRYQLSQLFNISARAINACVFGEHGDSEFVAWSIAKVAGVPLIDLLEDRQLNQEELEALYEQTRDAAYKIIEAKGATYYGVAMALTRICKAIFGDENELLMLSTLLQGEYGHEDVYISVPCILGRQGIRQVLTPELSAEEADKLAYSVKVLRENNPLIQEAK
ncbi:L-lactate dehydrogenase [Ignavigranum ruoffiae]|uniref:L-lactate dehydrogenase n=1 Tax=Ignavigranum ruoffiae TaxID=89093 RepID=UPI0023524F6B|nr:L-lactate dehydrogenase [Ignavigranum ruoffiae]